MQWSLFCALIHSIGVAILTLLFGSIVEKIVKRENHLEDVDYESSMVQKMFAVSSIVSFGGLLMLAYWERSFLGINALMLFLIIFK